MGYLILLGLVILIIIRAKRRTLARKRCRMYGHLWKYHRHFFVKCERCKVVRKDTTVLKKGRV